MLKASHPPPHMHHGDGKPGSSPHIGVKGINNRQNTGMFSALDKDFKVTDSINHRDILAWRERQQEWEDIMRHGRHIINTSLDIFTTMFDKISIPIEASLKQP